jgi:hypothetical protein
MHAQLNNVAAVGIHESDLAPLGVAGGNRLHIWRHMRAGQETCSTGAGVTRFGYGTHGSHSQVGIGPDEHDFFL